MNRPEIIEFQSINHNDAMINVAESKECLPFQVKRVYWLSEVPDGQIRGNSATIRGERILVCLNGSISIDLEDQDGKHFQFNLSNATKGLYVPPMMWSEITCHENAIILSMVSNEYDEQDYIREYDVFRAVKHLS